MVFTYGVGGFSINGDLATWKVLNLLLCASIQVPFLYNAIPVHYAC